MKKWSIVLALCMLSMTSLSGCGIGDKIEANLTGNSNHCIQGVEYIQFARGATVMYNVDGSIKLCN